MEGLLRGTVMAAVDGDLTGGLPGTLVSLQLLHKEDPLLPLMPAERNPVRTVTAAAECLSDRNRVGRTVLSGIDSLTELVFMRDCRIQVGQFRDKSC